MHDHDLLVLGAGPAGLGAAQRAARRGHDVAVLEARPWVGGAAASLEVDGIRVDLGSHRLHRATDPAILAELQRLLGDDLQVRPRNGRIRLAGRWLPFPLTPAALRHLPPGFALRAGLDTLTTPLRRRPARSFADAIRSGLGPTMLRRFYGPYAVKLWGLDPTEVDAEQARVRVGAASPSAILRRIVAGADPDARTFRYPRRGFGQISEALARDAEDAGATITLEARVRRIEPRGDAVTVHVDGGPPRTARTVWSTLPLPILARLVDGAPDNVLLAASQLRTRAMVLVYVTVPRDRLTSFDAHYLPEPWTPITRISEPKNYRDGRPLPDDAGDPATHTVLCAELPCHVGDEVWTASDTALADLVSTVLVVGGFPRAPIDGVTVQRLPSAYPVYDHGFAPRVRHIADWLDTQDGLLTFGRQGLFVHDNTHHALAMAWAAVDAIADDGRPDRAAWAHALDRFAAHVVED